MQRSTARAGWSIALITGALLLTSCGHFDPTKLEPPEFAWPPWDSSESQARQPVSPELAAALEEERVPTSLRLTGELWAVAVPLDGNGAGRIEALIANRRERTGRVERVSKLNQLVYDEKDYKFLRASVAFWRAPAGSPSGPGIHLMSPAESLEARRGTPRFAFIRSVPAFRWKPIQGVQSAGEVVSEAGAEGKRDRLVGRYMLKRVGRVNEYIASNTGTTFELILEIPLDVLDTVERENAAIYMDVTLGHEFRDRIDAKVPMTTLRGTFALRRSFRVGEAPLGELPPEGRTSTGARIYSDHLYRSDLVALASARRKALSDLEGMLGTGQRGTSQWNRAVAALQRYVGDCYLEARPRDLASVMPAMEAIETSQPGKLRPKGAVDVLSLPDGKKLTVQTGDVAVRLGTSRQIAVGTFPLPKVRSRDSDGFVLAMDLPGPANNYLIFRQFFSHPCNQPNLKELLVKAGLWGKVVPPVKRAIEEGIATAQAAIQRTLADSGGPREGETAEEAMARAAATACAELAAPSHPFLSPDPAATSVFLTVLDLYIDATIERETVATRVNDFWETEPIPDENPEVTAPADSPGDLVAFTPEQVKAMRGADMAELKAAVDARQPAFPDLVSPYDIPITDTKQLEEGLRYWPGTPFLSHVGLIVVEQVKGKDGTLRDQAVVYDAYPAEGIMRKDLHTFFGKEATMAAILRLKQPSDVPGRAAREIVDLYRLRQKKKGLRFGRATQVGDAAVEVLLQEGDGQAPPETRAQAWDSFDYAFDWRNQTRYSCSELVWAHYARGGINLADSFSMLLAPVKVAQDKLGWNVEVLIQASPQALILSDKLRRVVDFDSRAVEAALQRYTETGNAQSLPATIGRIGGDGPEGTVIHLHE